jgi:hypothetical protein
VGRVFADGICYHGDAHLRVDEVAQTTLRGRRRIDLTSCVSHTPIDTPIAAVSVEVQACSAPTPPRGVSAAIHALSRTAFRLRLRLHILDDGPEPAIVGTVDEHLAYL